MYSPWSLLPPNPSMLNMAIASALSSSKKCPYVMDRNSGSLTAMPSP